MPEKNPGRRPGVFVAPVLACLLSATSLMGAAKAQERIAFGYAAIGPTMAGAWMAKQQAITCWQSTWGKEGVPRRRTTNSS